MACSGTKWDGLASSVVVAVEEGGKVVFGRCSGLMAWSLGRAGDNGFGAGRERGVAGSKGDGRGMLPL